MREQLWRRGPDGAGEWLDPKLQIAMGSRRLAIVDLSKFGQQPMLSADGRFVLVMNGEVYNHQTLRAELEELGRQCRGSSDTEVLLESISAWGLEKSLDRSIGMFALALVDIGERRLFLVRDRLGEKPLYYGWSNNHFFFGSELKSFRPHPEFDPEVDRGALTLFVRYGYVPSPHCILKGFHKLLPGHILSLPLDGSAIAGSETLKSYWSLPNPGECTAFEGSAHDGVDKLEELLHEAVRLQMLADVPVGALLSGGIDSSMVVSLMQAQAATPVKTFSIGFPDARVDESGYAERVANYLGTDHTTWHCVDSELLELVGDVPRAYSEPFADDSQIPTLALARLVRRQVTVALSGDGGDELFIGYGRYWKSLQRWQQTQSYRGIGTGLKYGISKAEALAGLLPDTTLKQRWKGKLMRAHHQWLPNSLTAYYRHRISMNKSPELYLRQPEAKSEFFDEAEPLTAHSNDLSWLSYLDINTYLSDDILAKVDRAAMAFSVETRMPLLDHRIVEFALQLPDAIKRRDGKSKWPLRQILQKRLPAALTDRPKMGLSTPMGRWLQGPLRDWAESLLDEERLRREDYFEAKEVRRLWNQHQRGKRERGLMLWTFLMFQAWNGSF